MKKYILFFVWIILQETIAFGQFQDNIDSLKQVAEAMPNDTMKVKKINKICMQLISTGMFDEAEIYIEQTQKLSDSLKFKKGQGNALNFHGIICDERGRFSQALDYYFKALKIFEEMNHFGGITDITNNIGLIYLRQDQLDKALSYFFKAKKYAELSKKRFILDNPINNIGSVYLKKKDYTNALKTYKESYELRKELDFQNGCIQSLTNIGNVYICMQDTANAIENYMAALDLANKLNDQRSVAVVEAAIGPVYLSKNEQQAITYLKHALKLANEMDLMEEKRAINKNLSDYYSKSDPAAAFGYYKDFIAARDSMFNEANTRNSTSAEMNYEFDKKETLARVEQEKKDVIAKEEKNKQQIIIYAISAVLLMVGFLATFIYRGYRQKQKDNQIITKQKEEVEHQKHLVEEHQKEMVDSITYAKRLQDAILPPETMIRKSFVDAFLLFKPKDIVAGDFYWAERSGSVFYIATSDCTGHGVPGAMVSVVCSNALNRTLKEFNITDPGKILTKTRELIIETFEKSEGEVKDGMDCILCAFNSETLMLNYAAANNSFYIIRDKEIIHCKSDKMPVGKAPNDTVPFNTYTVQLQKNDIVYTFTDGYADQFGGPKGKKFKYKQLEELLLAHCDLPLKEQQQLLNSSFESWRGKLEQVDDVLLIGFKV